MANSLTPVTQTENAVLPAPEVGKYVRGNADASQYETRTAAEVISDIGANNAENIVNTPAGNIAATTIQAAVNELDTEKAIDAAVVHLTGSEAVTGVKTFTKPLSTADATAALGLATKQQMDTADALKSALSGADFTGRVTMKFGANLASAATVTLGTDGNAFHLTGTTTIADFTAITGSGPFFLVTDGILTFTHASGVLETNTGADITSAAGDRFRLDQDSDGTTWLITQLGAAGGGKVLQVVGTGFSSVATGTTIMPYDDTIPQNTEGDQYITQAITPLSATSTLHIHASANFASSATDRFNMALFRDSTANAVCARTFPQISNNNPWSFDLDWQVTSNATTATTFKIRAGLASAGTTTFNGANGTRAFGGVYGSYIRIIEVEA